MHFYKEKGKQVLDLRGDFILSKRDELVTSVAPSAAPRHVYFARYIPRIHKLGFTGKLRATGQAIAFIWAKGQI